MLIVGYLKGVGMNCCQFRSTTKESFSIVNHCSKDILIFYHYPHYAQMLLDCARANWTVND